MANHTPEQLMRWEQEGSEYISTGSGSITITEYDSFGMLVSDEKNSITTSRIVACVNACVGVSDDALDGGWEAAGLSAYAKRLEVDLAAVTAQRDELLGLLGKFFDAYENGTPCYEDPDDLDGYLGNAFVLGEEIFGRICEVLNQHEKSNDKIAGES